MDNFKYFSWPHKGTVTITLPDNVTKPREVLAPLNALGLQLPWNTDTFWQNSRYCKLTHNNTLIGELFICR
jgi:hypothetical protein